MARNVPIVKGQALREPYGLHFGDFNYYQPQVALHQHFIHMRKHGTAKEQGVVIDQSQKDGQEEFQDQF